jgi:hypothetical protein
LPLQYQVSELSEMVDKAGTVGESAGETGIFRLNRSGFSANRPRVYPCRRYSYCMDVQYLIYLKVVIPMSPPIFHIG